MTETFAQARCRLRATTFLERGEGFVIERDQDNEWDTWAVRPRGTGTASWWDDAAEIESRR